MTVTATAIPSSAYPAGPGLRRMDVRLAAYASVVFGGGGAVAILMASGMVVTIHGLLLPALTLVMAAVHGVYRRYQRGARIELVSGALAVMIGSSLAAGVISNAGLRLNRMLVDEWLTRADHAIGVDTEAWVRSFVGHAAIGNLLYLAYITTFPLVFACSIWLALRMDHKRVWEIASSFSICIVACSIISTAFPAIGNIAYKGLQGLAGHGLPANAGVYYLEAFHKLREGTDPTLDISHLEGVVTFPSFHAIMAIILAWALRGRGLAGWIALVWSGLILISTIPIGGHYVIDLLGGLAVWLLWLKTTTHALPLRQQPPSPREQCLADHRVDAVVAVHHLTYPEVHAD